MKPEKHAANTAVPGVKRCPRCQLLSPIQAPECVSCGHQYRGNLPYMPVSDRTQVLWFPMEQFPPPQAALPAPPSLPAPALSSQKALPARTLPVPRLRAAWSQFLPPHAVVRALRLPLFLTARLFLTVCHLSAAVLRRP